MGGLTAGASYQFRIRAFNVHGWSPFSIPTTIKAATQPEKPLPPVVTVNNILVKITWSVPYENSGQVNGYRVYIADADGVYTIETAYCNGLIEPVKT